MKAAYGGSSAVTPWQNASRGSPANSASARRVMLAWKMSPWWMYSTALRTASWCRSGPGMRRNVPNA